MAMNVIASFIFQCTIFFLSAQIQSMMIIPSVLIIVAVAILSVFLIMFIKTRNQLKNALAKPNQLNVPGLAGNERICSNCKTPNSQNARFCRSCGASLIQKPSSVICLSCGESNSMTARFCRKCGRRLK